MSETASPIAREPAPASASAQSISRLYITPLTPDLLPVILPPKLHQITKNISYHAPQTFPENSFGYISLPPDAAARLKSKLNGSILRGHKMRVEDARPDKASRRKTRATAEDDSPSPEDRTKGKDKKKSKKMAFRHAVVTDEGRTLPAVELPEDRHVKRGWTSSAKHQDKKSKKHSREDEPKQDNGEKGNVIFRAKVPPNINTDDKKEQKERHDKKDKRHTKSKSTTELTEFSKTTTFPTFLRESKLPENAKRASEFIEGKGWVDGDGNVVEAVEGSRKRRKTRASADDGRPNTRNTVTPDTAIPSREDDILPLRATELPTITSDISEKAVSATPDPTAQATSQSTDGAEPKQVHPLEELFKRPAPKIKGKTNKSEDEIHRPAPIKTGFSFFGSDDTKDGGTAEDDRVRLMMPPQTPFTRHDLEMRGVRSAAPTPDTAAIGQKFQMPWRKNTNDGSESSEEEEDDEQDEDEDEDDDENDTPTAGDDASETEVAVLDTQDGVAATDDSNNATQASGKEGEEQNEFEKHFWANRADYNRSWKARQKEVKKQARQNENRQRGAGRR